MKTSRPDFGFEQFHVGPLPDTNKLAAMGQLAAALPLRKQRKILSAMSGGHSSAIRGRGLDYAENRLYQAGDDIRAMDWRVTARTGEAHIKVYQEERERPVLLVGDFRSPMNFGSRRTLKQLLAAEVLALLGWATVKAGDRLGSSLFNDSGEQDLRPRPGSRQVMQLIRSLALFCDPRIPAAEAHSDPETRAASLRQRLLNLRRIAKPGSAIYIVSDWHDLDDEACQQLMQICRHCDVTAIHVFDPLEAELPEMGRMTVTDGRQRAQLVTDQRRRQQHQQQFSDRVEHQQKRLNRLGIPFISISTADNPLQRLRQGMGMATATNASKTGGRN